MNQKLAEARILAARKMPYMTHQVMALIPLEKPRVGTLAKGSLPLMELSRRENRDRPRERLPSCLTTAE